MCGFKATVRRCREAQRRLNRACATLAGLAMLAMMLVGAVDVLASNLDLVALPSMSIPSTTEFMASMMVVAVFFGLALAQERRGHVRVTLSRHGPGGAARAVEAVRHLLHGCFYAAIAWFGWSIAGHSVASGEFAPGLVNFPVWPARLALGFGATIMALQCAVDLLMALLVGADRAAPDS